MAVVSGLAEARVLMATIAAPTSAVAPKAARRLRAGPPEVGQDHQREDHEDRKDCDVEVAQRQQA